MMELYKKTYDMYKKYKQVIIYGIFGALTTGINLLIFYLLDEVLNIEYIVSNAVAWVLSVLFAYVTNKLFVFESKKSKNIVFEICSFYSFRLLTGLFDMGILILFVEVFDFNKMIVKAVSCIIVIILNYIFSKLIIFKKR